MFDYQLRALREWVKAEIEAAIAGAMPDQDGYVGANYDERQKADLFFDEFVTSIKHGV